MVMAGFGWYAIDFMCLAAIYSYIVDRRHIVKDVAVASIVVQLSCTLLVFNQVVDPPRLAASIMAIESTMAYLLWKERRYSMRVPYTALLVSTVMLVCLWGFDSIFKTGYLYSEDEPSAFTYMCSVLTVVQGGMLLMGCRRVNKNGRDRTSILDRIRAIFRRLVN